MPAVASASRSNVLLDFDELRRAGELHEGSLRLLGSWHTHPAGSSGDPSRRDLAAFLAMRDAFAAAGSTIPALGMIVSRGRSGWDEPVATGYLVGRNARGKADVAIAATQLPWRGARPDADELRSAALTEQPGCWSTIAFAERDEVGRYSRWYSFCQRRDPSGRLEYRDFRPPGIDPSAILAAHAARQGAK